MNISEKIERSKCKDKINFSKIGCLGKNDSLVLVESSEKIVVEPIWQKDGDLEGRLYADYISSHPEYDGVYVRSEVLKRLATAANSLGHPYKLIIRAGHRPIEVQKRLLNDVMKDYKNDNPGATNKQALEHARMYVSDPEVKLPPHCCGAAVDVDLINKDSGHLVDFGSSVNEDAEISHLHAEEITPEQRKNRLLLLTTMLEVGFSSYYAEWWHYSCGDETWAWFYHKESCLYGLAEV